MKKMATMPAREVARKWHKSHTFRAAYDALEAEFTEASRKIEALIKAKRSKRETKE